MKLLVIALLLLLGGCSDCYYGYGDAFYRDIERCLEVDGCTVDSFQLRMHEKRQRCLIRPGA